MTPNTYQDSFGEGSFVGKGIYDLEVFDKVLSDAFKDNLILSHLSFYASIHLGQ